MEKKIGLTSSELGEIFALIRSTGNDKYGNKIYNAYLPYTKVYAKQFHLSMEEVQDVYDDVLSFIYDNILKETIEPEDFNNCFGKAMMKKCVEVQNVHESAQFKFRSSMLQTSYENVVASNTSADMRKNVARQEFMTQSLLYTINLLNELKHNPQLAQQYELDELKISVFEDYYGINDDMTRHNIHEIAEKYEISEKRAMAVLGNASRLIKHINQLSSIRTALK